MLEPGFSDIASSRSTRLRYCFNVYNMVDMGDGGT